MRIVIVGLGQTGQELAKELIYAGHEIIVIDTEKELIEDFKQRTNSNSLSLWELKNWARPEY